MSRRNTLHWDALEASFYEAIDANPQMATLAAEVRGRIMKGDFYSLDIVNAALQKWEGDREITLIEAFGFAQVWSLTVDWSDHRTTFSWETWPGEPS